MPKTPWLLPLLGVLLPATGVAQSPPLTLAAVRSLARQTSPELTAMRAAADAARMEARQEGAFPNPLLTLVRERTSGSAGSNSQTTLQFDQRLDLTGVRTAQRSAALARAEAAEATVRRSELLMDARVTRLFGRLVTARRRVELADRLRGLADSATAITVRRFEAGDASGYDRRRFGLEAARYAGLAIATRFEADSAAAELNALMSRSPASPPAALDGTLPEGRIPPMDSLLAWMRERPDLEAAAHEASAADANALAQRRRWIPAPVVSAGYKSERSAGTAERFDGFVAGLSIPVPLWDRRSAGAGAGAALADEARARHDGLARDAEIEIRQLAAGLAAALEQQRLYAERLGADADQALAAIHVGFAEGEVTPVQWLDAVNAWHEARAALLLLDASVLDRMADLAAASGVSIERLTGTAR